MNPSTVNLIVFAEQMAALAAQTIMQLKGLLMGSSTQTADQILADADATYAQIIANAKGSGTGGS